MNLETLKEMAASAAVSAVVSFGVSHLAMAPLAHAITADSQLSPAPRVSTQVRPAPVEARGDSSEIREAYSDGGYWYWIEHQRAMP